MQSYLLRLGCLYTGGGRRAGLVSQALDNFKHLAGKITPTKIIRKTNGKQKLLKNRVGFKAYLQNPFDHIFLSFKGGDDLHLGQQQEQ